MNQHYLKTLFEPASIALFGASERQASVGAVVLRNLLEGKFHGRILPINPKHDMVQGVRCYRDLGEITQAIDLAVVAAPASTVPLIIDQCGQRRGSSR